MGQSQELYGHFPLNQRQRMKKSCDFQLTETAPAEGKVREIQNNRHKRKK